MSKGDTFGASSKKGCTTTLALEALGAPCWVGPSYGGETEMFFPERVLELGKAQGGKQRFLASMNEGH